MDKDFVFSIAVIFVLAVAGIFLHYMDSSGSQPKRENSLKQPQALRQEGPYFHSIYYAISSDGIEWKKQGLLFEHASVPGAVVKNGVIYLYFIDAGAVEGGKEMLAVAISSDLGKTYEKKKVLISGLNQNEAVDPHPELLENGKIRLYFFCSTFSRKCYSFNEEKTGIHKYFFSESNDGINFGEPAFSYEGMGITDPDAFRTGSGWRILANNGAKIDLLVSDDNGITFSKSKEFEYVGVVCDTFNFSGTFRTYCNEGNKIISHTGIDAGMLFREEGERISSENQTGDPSVIQLPDKTYLMFYKQFMAARQPLMASEEAK